MDHFLNVTGFRIIICPVSGIRFACTKENRRIDSSDRSRPAARPGVAPCWEDDCRKPGILAFPLCTHGAWDWPVRRVGQGREGAPQPRHSRMGPRQQIFLFIPTSKVTNRLCACSWAGTVYTCGWKTIIGRILFPFSYFFTFSSFLDSKVFSWYLNILAILFVSTSTVCVS